MSGTNTDILKNENDYLLKQYFQADNQLKGNQRMIEFNENYRKKQVEYNKIILFLLFSVIVFVIYNLLRNRIFFIPPQIMDIIIIIFFVYVIIHIVYNIYYILQRDNNNFDEINSPSNVPTNTGAVKYNQTNAQNSGDILNSYGLNITTECYGKSCCTDGSFYDGSSNICIPSFDYKGNLFISSANSNVTKAAVPFPILTGSSLNTTVYNISNSDCITANLQVCGKACISSSEKCIYS